MSLLVQVQHNLNSEDKVMVNSYGEEISRMPTVRDKQQP